MSGMHLTKEFFELLKAIGESKSKQEEDLIIEHELQTLKRKIEASTLKKPSISSKTNIVSGSNHNISLFNNKKKSKEFLVRLLYVEMLGHDGSFGYIKAVELAASSNILLKKTGYTLCGACLSPDHEFRFMLVNQIQRDLSSSSVLDVGTALVAATKIITGDMVPALSSEVIKHLNHSNETIRKKAIISLHRFHQISNDSVDRVMINDKLRRVLCDRDPSVMGSSLNVIDCLSSVDPSPFKDLVPSLVSILKQIIEHRLPTDFDYHRVPAPWMQMKIIRIIATLCKNDPSHSNQIYKILNECMKRANVGINAGYAVVYECVRTITAIYPNQELLDAAAESISRFFDSRSHNLKYFGVTGLAAIVEFHPQYATRHQMSVIDCLEDCDETLQRRTLDLLYKVTSINNVQFITEKMLHFLREEMTDDFLRRDLTEKVSKLAERYAPSNIWYIETITDLFEVSGDLVKNEVSQALCSLIAEGIGEEKDDEDVLLRQHAVKLYVHILDRPSVNLPKLLIETMAWVLGEYVYLSVEYKLEEVIDKLCLLVRKGTLAPSNRKVVITAIMKLVAQAGTCTQQAAKIINDFTMSKDVDIQQRCLEFQNILTNAPHIMAELFPVDASCEDFQIDPSLNFLNDFVKDSKKNGAKEYEKPENDDIDNYTYVIPSAENSVFKMTPYERPVVPKTGFFGYVSSMETNILAVAGKIVPPFASGANINSCGGLGKCAATTNEPELNLRNVANVWSKDELNQTPISSTPASSMPIPDLPTKSTLNSSGESFAPTSRVGAPPDSMKNEDQIRKERIAAELFCDTTPFRNHPKSRRPPRSRGVNVTATIKKSPPEPAQDIDFLCLISDSDPTPVSKSSTPAVDTLIPSPMKSLTFQPLPKDETAVISSLSLDLYSRKNHEYTTGETYLESQSSCSKFKFEGYEMVPLIISTEIFGQKWGTLPHTLTFSDTTSEINTLEKLMNLCEKIGAHKIESITVTNEGICGGMIRGSNFVLIHVKVSPLRKLSGVQIDASIKTSHVSLGESFASYLQRKISSI